MAGPMVDRVEQLAQILARPDDFDPDRALRRARAASRARRPTSMPEPVEPGRGEQGRVELAAPRPCASRVWTLPRIGTSRRSGRRASNCAVAAGRRGADPCALPAARRGSPPRSAGRACRRAAASAAIASVVGPDRLDILHRMDATGRCARRAGRASSSLVHSALPPTSASGRSWITSPVVVIGTISICLPPSRARRAARPPPAAPGRAPAASRACRCEGAGSCGA